MTPGRERERERERVKRMIKLRPTRPRVGRKVSRSEKAIERTNIKLSKR